MPVVIRCVRKPCVTHGSVFFRLVTFRIIMEIWDFCLEISLKNHWNFSRLVCGNPDYSMVDYLIIQLKTIIFLYLGPCGVHSGGRLSIKKSSRYKDKTVSQGLKLTLIPRSDFLLLLSKSWSKSDRHRSYFLSLKADIWLDWVAKLCS